jgi:threonine 3-dehydrogenase
MVYPRILITGGMGQIGSELVGALRKHFGHANVVASDVRAPRGDAYGRYKPFRHCDVLSYDRLEQIAVEEGIDWIVHNSAIMSVTGEQNPHRALEVNIKGVRNVLDLARNLNLRVLAPSTIAVYGPDAPKDNTPVDCALNPTTVYGITKVFLEHLGTYYMNR